MAGMVSKLISVGRWSSCVHFVARRVLLDREGKPDLRDLALVGIPQDQQVDVSPINLIPLFNT